ncbi:hypothetical protein E2C01_090896 [Portunus trituberculatus]|uniref:Uncharacterized protein n=1 Tax=Portunus trituberculatus TaxID=210409 RepID=A0A5B7JMZ8_PORTR|nr:hypothetical protein [Portunus trituberculatus]
MNEEAEFSLSACEIVIGWCFSARLLCCCGVVVHAPPPKGRCRLTFPCGRDGNGLHLEAT